MITITGVFCSTECDVCASLIVTVYSMHALHSFGRRSCTLSQKNDSDVAHFNFNAHQPIMVIFGTNVAERACYQMMICYPTSPN